MKELRHWPTLAANTWPIFGEKHWPSLGENTWPSIARKMTGAGAKAPKAPHRGTGRHKALAGTRMHRAGRRDKADHARAPPGLLHGTNHDGGTMCQRTGHTPPAVERRTKDARQNPTLLGTKAHESVSARSVTHGNPTA